MLVLLSPCPASLLHSVHRVGVMKEKCLWTNFWQLNTKRQITPAWLAEPKTVPLHFWSNHFPQSFSAAETGLESLKASGNRGLWASSSFSLQRHNYRYSALSRSTRAWRGSLALSVSLPAASPLSMVRWKPLGCLSLQALAPKWRAVSDEDSIGEESGIWWGGRDGCLGIIFSARARGRRSHLQVPCSLQMHEEHFACASQFS